MIRTARVILETAAELACLGLFLWSVLAWAIYLA